MSEELTFLEGVAAAYASRQEDLSEYCFLFPNKRAGTFFLRGLANSLGGRTIMAPKVMTMTDFVTDIADRIPASRIDLIFRLYKIYQRICGNGDSITLDDEKAELAFDRFAPWAEVILSDFNEVERYNVDASKLFYNVKDYQEISSNYLTDEQLEVMERYFGYRPAQDSVDRFWKSMKLEEESSTLRKRFVYLWQILPQLFEELLAELDSEGLCILGSAYRIAMHKIEDSTAELRWKRVVAVGFNSLSTTENLIFKALQGVDASDGGDYIEFFWDATGPVLTDKTMGVAREMERNMRNFPMPEWSRKWMECTERSAMPAEISVEAAPSNAAQVKIAGQKIECLIGRAGAQSVQNARTAVILPDENLLLPLLYSMPEELESVNLTMGYAMRFTAVASFMYHFRRLHTCKRTAHGETGFYFEDFKAFLGHPLLHVMIGSEAVCKLNDYIDKHHRYVVTIEDIKQFSESCAELLTPPADDATVSENIDYLEEVMARLDAALASSSTPELKHSIERSHIVLYRNALQQLHDCVETYHVTMQSQSVFRLVDRLLAGEKITFEGEPLEGLQILGVLETRAIDFDNIIILSANDKVLPTRARKRSFIPDSLRSGYGLPVSSSAESLYAYYFWRLLSRAKDVTIIYDARAGAGMRSGGKSRFLLQLDLLYGEDKVKHNNYAFTLNATESTTRPVKKTEKVMARLEEFKKEKDGRNLSASALKKYLECPVRFYYESVVGIGDDPAVADGVSDIIMGNILHFAMENIYVPKEEQEKYLHNRILITPEWLDNLLADRTQIEKWVRRGVNKHYYNLPDTECDRGLNGSVEIVAQRIADRVEDILRYDRTIAPFEIVGVEIKGNDRWEVTPDLVLNIRYAFDRVDFKDGVWRMVDYKTGKGNVSAGNVDEIFEGTSDSKNLFQLLCYANLLSRRVEKESGGNAGNVSLSIYSVDAIEKADSVEVKANVGGELKGYLDCNADFITRFNAMLEAIYDSTQDFEPTTNPDHCKFCRIASLCGKS